MTRLHRLGKRGWTALAILGLLFPPALFVIALIHFAAILPDGHVDAVNKALWFFMLAVCLAGSAAYVLVIGFELGFGWNIRTPLRRMGVTIGKQSL